MTNFLRGLVALTVLLAPTQMLAQARYTPPRTPWGQPDISGDYTNKDEANTPLERPEEFKGRDPRSFTQAELDELVKKRQSQAAAIAGGIGGAETGAGPTHWYEHLRGTGNRPWFVTDPADGKLPPMTPQALKREAAVAALNDARNGEGRADSWLDRSTYDRCITRGLPGSMMPAIYGNAYQIMQTPDSVVIRYEMIHETRVIPIDGRPHVSKAIRGYLGDARGHWDGNTLVVETTNFKDQIAYRNANGATLRIVERFTPLNPGTVEWSTTIDDPATWTRPWTFAMNLTKKDPSQQPFEYACHEGNYGLRNILSGARAEERARAAAPSK
jgi:hypothetical protein